MIDYKKVIKSKNWHMNDNYDEHDLKELCNVIIPNKAGISADLLKLIQDLLSNKHELSVCERYYILSHTDNKKKRTLYLFQIRYGKELGVKKFNDRLKKINTNLPISMAKKFKEKKEQNRKYFQKNILPKLLTNKNYKGNIYIQFCSDTDVINICRFQIGNKIINLYKSEILTILKNKKVFNISYLHYLYNFYHKNGKKWIDVYYEIKNINPFSKEYYVKRYGKKWSNNYYKNFGQKSKNHIIGLFKFYSIGNRNKIIQSKIFNSISEKYIKNITNKKSKYSQKERFDFLLTNNSNTNLYKLMKYGDKLGSEKIKNLKITRRKQGINIKNKRFDVDYVKRKINQRKSKNINLNFIDKNLLKLYNHNYILLDEIIFSISQYRKVDKKILLEYAKEKNYSKKNFIKYGKEKYENILKNKAEKYNRKLFKKGQSGKYGSKESLILFTPFIEEILKNKPNTHIFVGGFGRREYRISELINDKHQHFFYDLTFLKEKLIFEYNGSIWHPNPNVHDNFNKWSHPFDNNITAQEKYDHDCLKKQIAEKNGFIVIELWDFDGIERNKEIMLKILKEKNLL